MPARVADRDGAADSRARAASRSAVRRDLHVVRIPFHDPHRMAGPLGEPGFVGRVDARAAERDGVAEAPTRERLRRLRQIDRLSRQRLHDGRRRGVRRHSLDGIGDGHGRNRGTVAAAAAIARGDQVCGDEGARGVVDQHDVGLFPYQLECPRDRILPAPAACDNRSVL